MEFCVVGLNHNIAPIEIRERVHFKESDIINANNLLQGDSLKELIVLSTCNRSEIYFYSEDYERDIVKVKSFFEEYFNVKDIDFIEKSKDSALEHLFKVVIGLDSLVFGEDQILGQVVDAHQTGMDIGGAEKNLNKVFREAITFSKKIKTDTNISDHPTSIAYIGVKKIAEQMDLEGKTVLIVGLGNMGQLALVHMLEYGAKIFISNRTAENSQKIKLAHPEIEIIDYARVRSHLNEVDVLISATSYPNALFSKEDFLDLNRELHIMDLSLPRDVDSNVLENPHIHLYDIDSLTTISQMSLESKKKILESYEDEIRGQIESINTWIANSDVDPILQTVNERCEQIAADTLNYIFRKTNLSYGEKVKVQKIVESSLKKVMKEPLLSLKSLEDSEDKAVAIRVLEELFEQ